MFETRPLNVMVISDTHALPVQFQKLPECEVLVHCGDMTESGQLSEYQRTLELLGEIKADVKFIIAGNHDLTLDKDLCQEHDAMKQHEAALSLFTRAADQGVHYLAEGIHTFKLPRDGFELTIYASPRTVGAGNGWAFQYQTTPDTYKGLIPGVDLAITHSPPRYILDECSNGQNAGCDLLLQALQHSRPLLHCFGHVHEGFGAQRVNWDSEESRIAVNEFDAQPKQWIGQNEMRRRGHVRARARDLVRGHQTLCVNAAILDGQHRPSHAPWVVELELASKREVPCDVDGK